MVYSIYIYGWFYTKINIKKISRKYIIPKKNPYDLINIYIYIYIYYI